MVDLWNDLPEAVVQSADVNVFRNKVDHTNIMSITKTVNTLKERQDKVEDELVS